MEICRDDAGEFLNFVKGMSKEEKILYLANVCNTAPQVFAHFDDERLTVTIINYIQRQNRRERVFAEIQERQRLRGIVDTRNKISGAYRRAVQTSNPGNELFVENVKARTDLASRKLHESLEAQKRALLEKMTKRTG